MSDFYSFKVMYKFKFLSFTSALALLLSGCQSSDIEASVKSDDLVKVDILLNVSVDHGLTLVSRAGDSDPSDDPLSYSGEQNTAPRALISWDGQQSINDLRVYVFGSETKDGEYIYEADGEQIDGSYRIETFNNNLPWQMDSSNPYAQRFESHLFAFSPVLRKDRYYKFLAVGRDDDDSEALPSRPVSYIKWGTKTLGDVEVVPGVTKLHDVKLSNIQGSNHYPYNCTEVFSGFLTYTAIDGTEGEDYIFVNKDLKGFQKNIVLHRAVAGLWIYVTDIPTSAIDNTGRETFDGLVFNPKELSVNISTSTRSLNLADRCEAAGSEHEFNTQVGYVNFLNLYGQKFDKLWYDDGDKFWKRDAIVDYRGMNIKANSALMSNFLLPIDVSAMSDSEATLTIHLREEENSKEYIRKVKCRISEIKDPTTGIYSQYVGDGLKFPIVANCLYVIGSPDAPYSLSRMLARSADDDVIEMQVINF